MRADKKGTYLAHAMKMECIVDVKNDLWSSDI